MVKVGEVYWVARVEGQGKASAAAQNLQDDMGQVAQKSDKAAAAQNSVGESTSETTDKVESATRATGVYRTAQGLLTSTLYFAAARTGVLTAYTKAYSLAATVATAATSAWATSLGVLGSVKAGLLAAGGKLLALGSSFVSWLAAGSAGALAFAGAIGAAVGILGVWILDTIGALDAIQKFGGWVRNVLPDWVADGMNMLLSVAVGPLAVFGGFIIGFIRGGFDEAFRMAGKVVDSFIGSWAANIERLKNLWDSGTNYLGNKWGQLTGVLRNKGASALDFLSGKWEGFKQTVFGIIDSIIGKLRDMIETAQEAADAVPGSDVAGDVAGGAGGVVGDAVDTGGDIVGGAADAVGLDSGGRILESGIAEVHKGEAVIPRTLVEAAEQGANRVGSMARDNVSVEVENRTGGGEGGGGETKVENTYDITVGDQSLDLSNLSRSDLRTLAGLIGDQIGDNTAVKPGGG